MIDAGLWEFCEANASSGVLLIALAGFARWIGPRIDKLIDAHLAEQKESRQQLARIEEFQKQQVCRFDAGAADSRRGATA